MAPDNRSLYDTEETVLRWKKHGMGPLPGYQGLAVERSLIWTMSPPSAYVTNLLLSITFLLNQEASLPCIENGVSHKEKSAAADSCF